jgi:hypothetical protein
LSAQALQGLHQAKHQIIDAAVGRLPERLVEATAEAAIRLAHRQHVPAELMSERALELAREILHGLAQEKWKPETALKLQKSCRRRECVSAQKESGHGLS